MKLLLAIALGGAVGSVLRYLLSRGVQNFCYTFPLGILAVNIIGSFAMGLLATLLVDRFAVDAVWRAMILIGLLGGFTTFSSFSIDSVNLLKNGMTLQMLFYVVASVTFSIVAAWLGVIVARSV